MTDQSTRKDAVPDLSRRGALAVAGACFAMLSQRALAEVDPAAPAPPAPPEKLGFSKDPDSEGLIEVKGIHQGKGQGNIKFFRFGGASAPSAPTYFLIYELQPGASEGTHVHFLDNRNKEGSFDEYYYILSGEGQMEIDGKNVPVKTGDHLHTPLEVSHGIENTHPTQTLRVFLTYIKRGTETYPIKRTPPPKPAGA